MRRKILGSGFLVLGSLTPYGISMYSGGPTLSMPYVLPSVPPVSSMRYDQRAESGSGLGLLSSGSLYGYGFVSVGENSYGSMSLYSSKLYGGSALPPPPTLEMLVPVNRKLFR
ncbi:hypothetical protein PS1_023146 [Malus domestica]